MKIEVSHGTLPRSCPARDSRKGLVGWDRWDRQDRWDITAWSDNGKSAPENPQVCGTS
jgi:hypothetical protein